MLEKGLRGSYSSLFDVAGSPGAENDEHPDLQIPSDPVEREITIEEDNFDFLDNQDASHEVSLDTHVDSVGNANEKQMSLTSPSALESRANILTVSKFLPSIARIPSHSFTPESATISGWKLIRRLGDGYNLPFSQEI